MHISGSASRSTSRDGQLSLDAHQAEAEKHTLQIQSLELRLMSQSRATETRHWDIEGLKEELAKLQGQLDIAQSCLEVAQQQSRRYSEQLESSQKSLR
jgi:chromosome segregation ATPase